MLKTIVQFTIEWDEEIKEEDLHAVEEALRNQILHLASDIKRAYPEAGIGGITVSHH